VETTRTVVRKKGAPCIARSAFTNHQPVSD
jgi:hypothetical protein